MTKPERVAQDFAEKVANACRRDHKSPETRKQYSAYALRFARWLWRRKDLREASSEVKVSSFLSWLATRPKGCSAKTQHGALCALVFAYKKGLETPLGEMPPWVRPTLKPRLPTWLSAGEFTALERHLSGDCLEMAQVMFGSGLRLFEVLRLRVRDLDFDTGMIIVREGKGGKDRLTPFPNVLKPVFRERLERLNDLWLRDCEENVPGVCLPDDVGRKYPGYGMEWPWQWVFPARGLSTDPESGIVRRHHVHEDTLAKALKKAARLARLRKRVTAHVLRHSFATAFLANGGTVQDLKELMGHNDLSTTEVYTHCIPQAAARVVSPLDVRPNVVPFATGETMRPAAALRMA